MSLTPSRPIENQFLASLSPKDFDLLKEHLQPRNLEMGQVLFEPGAVIDYAYFPLTVVLSAITVLNDGSMIEVGTVGHEGAVGIALASDLPSPHRMLTQIPGIAERIAASALAKLIRSSDSLCRSATAYQIAFLMQVSRSVACNGLHKIEQRCCRWLLMTRDRVLADTFPLTHEYLSFMLGVRRSGVTEVLQSLKERHYIDYSRGSVSILDRSGLESVSCECYFAVRDYYKSLYSAS